MNHLPDLTPEELHALVTGMDVETLPQYLSTLCEAAFRKGRWVEILRRQRNWQDDERLSDRQLRIMAWMERRSCEEPSRWFKQDYVLLLMQDMNPDERDRAEKLLRDKLRSLGMADAIRGVAAEMEWLPPTAAKDEFAKLVEYGYLFSNPGKAVGGYKHWWAYYTVDATEDEFGEI